MRRPTGACRGPIATIFWLVAELTGSNRSGPDWEADFSRAVSLIDDRGLWIRPLGGVVECEEGAAKPLEVVRAGERFEACVALPVPVRTPVKAVAFGSPSADADPQPWIRVSVPPTVSPTVSPGAPASPPAAGKVGDPPVVITLADTTMQAGFDIVLTPSGCVGDRRPGMIGEQTVQAVDRVHTMWASSRTVLNTSGLDREWS